MIKTCRVPPPGGTADQGSRKWDQVAGRWSGDIRKPPQLASDGHRGDGCSRDRGSPRCFLPSSLLLADTLLHSFLPHQEASERLCVQAGQPGAEAHQEVTFEGCEEGKYELKPSSYFKVRNRTRVPTDCQYWVMSALRFSSPWTCFVAVMPV